MGALTFTNAFGQMRYVSCVSLLPPDRITYASSERAVDALRLPRAVALAFSTLLDAQYGLGCSVTCEPVAVDG